MYQLELTFDELNALKNYASSMVTGNRSTRVRDASTLMFWNNLNEKLLLASHHVKVGQSATESHANRTSDSQPRTNPDFSVDEKGAFSSNSANPNMVDSDQAWTHPDAEPHKQP